MCNWLIVGKSSDQHMQTRLISTEVEDSPANAEFGLPVVDLREHALERVGGVVGELEGHLGADVAEQGGRLHVRVHQVLDRLHALLLHQR